MMKLPRVFASQLALLFLMFLLIVAPCRVAAQEDDNPLQSLTDSFDKACGSAQQLGLAKCNSKKVPNIRGKWTGNNDQRTDARAGALDVEFTITDEDAQGNFSGTGSSRASDGADSSWTISGNVTGDKFQATESITESHLIPHSVITSWCNETLDAKIDASGSSIHGTGIGSCNGGDVSFTRSTAQRSDTVAEQPKRDLEFGDVLSKPFLNATKAGREAVQ